MSSNANSLHLMSISPDNGSSDVNTSTSIKVSFNRALNKSTIVKNFLLIEDPTGTIENINDITSKPYSIIQGNIKCDEFSIEFSPKSELLNGTRYVIYIRRNISSIYGDILLQDKMYSFSTSVGDFGDIAGIGTRISPPTITNPENNSIINRLNTIDIIANNTDIGTYIQLSNTDDFSNILFEYKSEDITESVYINKKLNDDNYYIRAKTFNSEWCEPTQVYIQRLEESPVCISDLFDTDFTSDDLDAPSDVIDDIVEVSIYPTGRIGNNISNIKLEFNKILDTRHIKEISLSKIFNVLLDEDAHDDINFNSYSICHDIDNEKTHLIIHLSKTIDK